ncbi:hypothetical protein DTO013E5_3403 [Penicillium roqueforti]|uniref:Genomic scaffold, ProqFM164S02 n=1 Tax=Penicillium roqueforti (strain FM164) TaxID=1365484 RepID=W6Q6T0_PENRF|nr:uncharacterized protein LCP9604111_6920 [Penicillium roqueforti]CDM32413.1 unnamed protein product [Penicillium roqueforti FM164]KAF9245602.1 hypothetical protein LCP9604111_6920 [Penicillium roqueforti]KAI1833004.1 hypothetical protein CBS147337_6415 [Penicillium roqueforti]KAI2675782.1 hypothetical protein CBS147355_5963 [Penicillium roqueforti]KAI2689449.1 hypothetical protein LCP963914a_2538 [Penicillium roqueforti]
MADRGPGTAATVDLLILDYMVCLCISGLLEGISQARASEDIEYFALFVEQLHRRLALHHLESPLPWDLDFKLRIFYMSNLFLHWYPPKDYDMGPFVPLSDIAVHFLDLCLDAVAHVSRGRWFDLGAHFMVHAMLEEHARFPDQLDALCNWRTNDSELDIWWEVSRNWFLGHMPPPFGTAGPMSQAEINEGFPLQALQHRYVEFFEDLMDVLDVPLLLQLEQGQLEGLTREETRQVREYCGI